jgi:hypothetical protein
MTDNDFTPEQRAELGDVQPLIQHLAHYDVPEPDSVRLLTTLKPLLKARRETETPILEFQQRSFRDWLRLAWAQTELLEGPFWWSSLLLSAVGLFLGLSYGSAFTILCLVFLSPLIAAAGVAYIFRPATRTIWELERLSLVQPFELLYARLALILMMNILLAIGLMLAVWSQGAQLILWRLLLIWFGPMIGMTGIALFCSVRWTTIAGMVAPMAIWLGMIALGWRETVFSNTMTTATLIAQIDTSNALLLTALTAFIVGLVCLYESGRWVTRWR